MDIKTSVKHRREARIRELLNEALPDGRTELSTHRSIQAASIVDKPVVPHNTLRDPILKDVETERDPEKMWKQGHRGWYDNLNEPIIPPRKSSFTVSLLRRLTVSVLVFGTVWGIFSIQEPWATKTQGYIVDGLSREMDFQAAQTWYEDHFGGPPSFIPIFGQREEDSTKVNASASLVPPLDGNLVQSFAVDLKGVLISPKGDSLSSHEVKSVETGRVLEVKKQPDSSISVLIQHTGKKTAIYSRLSATTLKVNDWVQGGDIIGTLPFVLSDGEPPALYFMLKDGDRSMDPTEVIPFD